MDDLRQHRPLFTHTHPVSLTLFSLTRRAFSEFNTVITASKPLSVSLLQLLFYHSLDRYVSYILKKKNSLGTTTIKLAVAVQTPTLGSIDSNVCLVFFLLFSLCPFYIIRRATYPLVSSVGLFLLLADSIQ